MTHEISVDGLDEPFGLLGQPVLCQGRRIFKNHEVDELCAVVLALEGDIQQCARLIVLHMQDESPDSIFATLDEFGLNLELGDTTNALAAKLERIDLGPLRPTFMNDRLSSSRFLPIEGFLIDVQPAPSPHSLSIYAKFARTDNLFVLDSANKSSN